MRSKRCPHLVVLPRIPPTAAPFPCLSRRIQPAARVVFLAVARQKVCRPLPKVARPLGPFCACFSPFFVQKETSDGGEPRPTSWTRHFLPRRVRLAYARERAVEQGRSGRSCPLLLLCARHSVWICCELVGVGCPFVVLVNTVMSVILAIAITAIAAITAIIKPIRQPSFSSDSFSIGLPAAYHSSRCLVKGARRKSAKGRGLRP